MSCHQDIDRCVRLDLTLLGRGFLFRCCEQFRRRSMRFEQIACRPSRDHTLGRIFLLLMEETLGELLLLEYESYGLGLRLARYCLASALEAESTSIAFFCAARSTSRSSPLTWLPPSTVVLLLEPSIVLRCWTR